MSLRSGVSVFVAALAGLAAGAVAIVLITAGSAPEQTTTHLVARMTTRASESAARIEGLRERRERIRTTDRGPDSERAFERSLGRSEHDNPAPVRYRGIERGRWSPGASSRPSLATRPVASTRTPGGRSAR